MKWLERTLNRFKIDTPQQLRDSGVLSMNGRNLNFISRYNPRTLLPIVDDKLITKRMAEAAGISVPKLIDVIEYQADIRRLESIIMPLQQFVIKPSKGSGGKGIIVITSRNGANFVKASGEELSLEDISRDVSNILGGLYSLGGKSDAAMIESLIIADPVFNSYSYEGVPDIRVIVFKGFPVMAMMRLATSASDGKANLHQGAVGVGLNIVDGSSLRTVQHNKPLRYHPDTGQDLTTLQVPHWEQILTLSASCYDMSKLGYLGVDMVLDKNRGPLILELNARPGLAIQIANGQSIKARLEQVESLDNKILSVTERVSYARQFFNSHA